MDYLATKGLVDWIVSPIFAAENKKFYKELDIQKLPPTLREEMAGSTVPSFNIPELELFMATRKCYKVCDIVTKKGGSREVNVLTEESSLAMNSIDALYDARISR